MDLICKIDETFNFDNKEIRVIGTNDEPWFVAKDICDILGLTNITNSLRNIPENWMTLQNVKSSYNSQNMILINEAAVYRLIMRSNKPIAQKFQEVVCGEILPSIRKKGEFKLKQLLEEKEQEKLIILEEKLKIEEEKNRIEEEKNKLERKFIKKPKEIIEGKNVVYLMTTEEAEVKREYIIGKAIDLNNRQDNYNNSKLHDFKIVHYISCKSPKIMDILESFILSDLGQYRNKFGRDVFYLPEDKDISLFIEVFNFILKRCEHWNDETTKYAQRTITTDKEKDKERRKNITEEQRKKNCQQVKNFYEDNKEIMQKLRKIYNKENIEKVREKNKKNYEKHKEQRIEDAKEYYYENKEEILEKRKDYYKENKEEILVKREEYYKENYETKIAPQRQKIVLCECGIPVTHYKLSSHRKTDEHKNLLELRNNLDEYNEGITSEASKKVVCECGMIMNKSSIKNHKKKKTHENAMKLLAEMNN
jgi:prophage antirepressor-like protein